MTTPAVQGQPADLAVVAEALRHAAETPYDRAWAMPSGFYNDPRILLLERNQLFRRTWICVGRIEELAHNGDFMALDILEEPIIVARAFDGKIRAFSNVCRHRGMPLALGHGNAKALMCPYHHWSYDMTGRLIAAPRMGTRCDFDQAACRLPEFAVEQWQGFLFVCLAADPPPLAPCLAGLETMIRPYHLEQTKLRYLSDEIWHTNWKNLLENFMEGYHLSTLHRDTLHKVNPTRLCRHFPPGESYFGYYAGFPPELPRTHKGHPDLSEGQIGECVMFAVPPALLVGCAADYSSFICLQPEAIDRVRVKIGLIFFGPDWPQDVVDWAVDLFKKTMAEDKTVLVNLPRGLASQFYDKGPLAAADFEGSIVDFYRYMGRHLLPALGACSSNCVGN